MSTPTAQWIGFHVFLLVLLAAELGYARRARGRAAAAESMRHTALVATVGWLVAALALAGFVYWRSGPHATTEYLAGYAIEQALSVDNLFVFLLLFGVFRITPENQPRVLFWGVAGAIVMRGAFIALGLGLLARFTWISYAFGAFLLVAAVRLLLPKDRGAEDRPPRWLAWLSRLHPISLRQDRFFTMEDGRRMATVLTLALIAIELTDVVFALDSIPAVLSVTRQPFLAYTSNIMAVMGLRSLFFLLAHLLTRLRFLSLGLAAVLAFAAIKMLVEPWLTIGPITSLTVILALLAVTVALSLARPLTTPAR